MTLLRSEGVGTVQRDLPAVVGAGGGQDGGQEEVGDPHTGAGGQTETEEQHVGQPHVGAGLKGPGLPVMVSTSTSPSQVSVKSPVNYSAVWRFIFSPFITNGFLHSNGSTIGIA